MDKLIDNYIEELIRRRFSNFTVKSYKTDLQEFSSFLRKNGKGDFSKMDRKDIRSFIGELLSYGYKKSSVSRKLSAIKSFCKFLERNKIIKGNPSVSVKTPKTEKCIPSFLSEEEVRIAEIQLVTAQRKVRLLRKLAQVALQGAQAELASASDERAAAKKQYEAGVAKISSVREADRRLTGAKSRMEMLEAILEGD